MSDRGELEWMRSPHSYLWDGVFFPMADGTHWQIDKKLAGAVVAFLLANSVSTIWFFAGLDHRVSQLEKTDAIRIDKDLAVMKSEVQTIKSDVRDTKQKIERIEDKLDRIITRDGN